MEQDRKNKVSVQIDMTPEGDFVSPAGSPFGNKVLKVALVIAAIAAAGVLASLAFWLAVTLIPIAIGAGLIAYGILRYRIWQATRNGGFPPPV
jgi:hypothetical protein